MTSKAKASWSRKTRGWNLRKCIRGTLNKWVIPKTADQTFKMMWQWKGSNWNLSLFAAEIWRPRHQRCIHMYGGRLDKTWSQQWRNLGTACLLAEEQSAARYVCHWSSFHILLCVVVSGVQPFQVNLYACSVQVSGADIHWRCGWCGDTGDAIHHGARANGQQRQKATSRLSEQGVGRTVQEESGKSLCEWVFAALCLHGLFWKFLRSFLQVDTFEFEAVQLYSPHKVVIGHNCTEPGLYPIVALFATCTGFQGLSFSGAVTTMDGMSFASFGALSFSGAGWYLEKVLIKDVATPKDEFVFVCNRWRLNHFEQNCLWSCFCCEAVVGMRMFWSWLGRFVLFQSNWARKKWVQWEVGAVNDSFSFLGKNLLCSKKFYFSVADG